MNKIVLMTSSATVAVFLVAGGDDVSAGFDEFNQAPAFGTDQQVVTGAKPDPTWFVDMETPDECRSFVNNHFAQALTTNHQRFSQCQEAVDTMEGPPSRPYCGMTAYPQCQSFVDYTCEIDDIKFEWLAACQKVVYEKLSDQYGPDDQRQTDASSTEEAEQQVLEEEEVPLEEGQGDAEHAYGLEDGQPYTGGDDPKALIRGRMAGLANRGVAKEEASGGPTERQQRAAVDQGLIQVQEELLLLRERQLRERLAQLRSEEERRGAAEAFRRRVAEEQRRLQEFREQNRSGSLDAGGLTAFLQGLGTGMQAFGILQGLTAPTAAARPAPSVPRGNHGMQGAKMCPNGTIVPANRSCPPAPSPSRSRSTPCKNAWGGDCTVPGE